MFIGRGDDFVVAHRAAGLDDGFDAEFCGDIETVAEREECIGGHNCTGDFESFVLGLHGCDAARDYATHLACADAERHLVAHVDDRIRLHVLADLPREHEIVELGRSRLALGDDPEIGFRHHALIARLHEQAAVHAAIFVTNVARFQAARAQHSNVLFASTHFERLGFDFRRDDQLDELTIDDGACGRCVQRTIERDDAAECGSGIGLECLVVRRERVGSDSYAAGICVFHDYAGWLGKLTHAFECSVAICDVVVRECLALQLRRAADARALQVGNRVERAALVRILAVAQIHAFAEMQSERRRELGSRILGHTREIASHGRVVARRVRVGLRCEPSARLLAHTAVRRNLVQDAGVVAGVHHDAHAIVILRGRTDHRRPADVDVLDRVFECAIRLRDRRGERIEIHHHQIDRIDAMRAHHFIVDVATSQQSAVNLRMQRLHATIHDFRKAGVRRHFGHLDAILFEQRGGAARRENRDAPLLQCTSEIDEAVFVGDA